MTPTHSRGGGTQPDYPLLYMNKKRVREERRGEREGKGIYIHIPFSVGMLYFSTGNFRIFSSLFGPSMEASHLASPLLSMICVRGVERAAAWLGAGHKPGISTHHITSHHITSHHITSHHITSHHITSLITSHHITSHHITSLITPHHITSHHITCRHITC